MTGRDDELRRHMSIHLKRVYDEYSKEDGYRVLVDRLWPRGISKEKLHIDKWLKEIAPSNDLRKWYGHDPEKWDQFKQRYFSELQTKEPLVQELLQHIEAGPITLVYSTKETEYNNAVALKEYLLGRVSNQ
jgi:uncharacterized protein YeaO (DUF488 family)